MTVLELPGVVSYPIRDVPGRISAFGAIKGHGEVALILGPTACVFVVLVRDGAHVWRGNSFASPSSNMRSVMSEGEAGALLAEARNTPFADTPETHRGEWKCKVTLTTNNGLSSVVPQVLLWRQVAPYAQLGLESHAKGWKWTVLRTGKWFSKEKTQYSSDEQAFGPCLAEGYRVALNLVQEACGTRDTRRRGTLDPEYAAQHPGKVPTVRPEPTEKFAMTGAPKVPPGYEEIAKWDKPARTWLIAVNKGGRLIWSPPPKSMDPGQSGAPSKLRRAIEAAWAEFGPPPGLVLPPAAKTGPRKTSFKILREFGNRFQTEKGVQLTDRIAAREGALTVDRAGIAKIYVFPDTSAIAIGRESWMPVRLIRGKWRALDHDGKAIDGGWALPVKEEAPKAPRQPRAARVAHATNTTGAPKSGPRTATSAVRMWRIENTLSGQHIGDFPGANKTEARLRMVKDAGYSSIREAEDAAPTQPGELSFTEISVAAPAVDPRKDAVMVAAIGSSLRAAMGLPPN